MWDYYKNVTDNDQYEVGGAPTVTYSQNRVNVSYNLKTGIIGYIKTRDRNDGIGKLPFVSTTDESVAEKLVVRGSYICNLWEIHFSRGCLC